MTGLDILPQSRLDSIFTRCNLILNTHFLVSFPLQRHRALQGSRPNGAEHQVRQDSAVQQERHADKRIERCHRPKCDISNEVGYTE